MIYYITRHDHSSLPGKHADDNRNKFTRLQTKFLGQATTKHAHEFEEAWHSVDEQNKFNPYIHIPIILTIKTLNNNSLSYAPHRCKIITLAPAFH